jgi:hypothetical protein
MYTQQFYDCSVHGVITAWGQLTTMLGVTSHSWWMNVLIQCNFPRAFLVHCITNGPLPIRTPNSHFDSLCSQRPLPSAENGHWEQSEPKWLQLMVHMFFLTHC